ncbi:hypothetical protein [Chitinophaga sp. 212800010-3]|uniref:hypothetical protein n=1 Tax=unclassified Chitinophaga TaxID=2619133 RepID=UPI002E12C29D
MKKVRTLVVIFAMASGIIPAFAFADDPVCAISPVGYIQPIDNPTYIIPGTYGITYLCIPSTTEICRYVKKTDGYFVACSGNLIILYK